MRAEGRQQAVEPGALDGGVVAPAGAVALLDITSPVTAHEDKAGHNGTNGQLAKRESHGVAPADGQDPWAVVAKDPLKLLPGTTIALRGGKDKLWCADEAGGIVCNRKDIGPWEKFTVVGADNNRVALKGGRSNQFCTAGGDGKVVCNAHFLGGDQKFTEVNGQGLWEGVDRVVAIAGPNGKYCADEGNRVLCDRKHVADWEKFWVTFQDPVRLVPGTTVALRGGKDKLWCADEAGGLICNRKDIGPWEKFKVVYTGQRGVALKGGRSNLFCTIAGNGVVACNSQTVGDAQRFIEGNFENVKDGFEGRVSMAGPNGRYCADESHRVICDRKNLGDWEKFWVVTQPESAVR